MHIQKKTWVLPHPKPIQFHIFTLRFTKNWLRTKYFSLKDVCALCVTKIFTKSCLVLGCSSLIVPSFSAFQWSYFVLFFVLRTKEEFTSSQKCGRSISWKREGSKSVNMTKQWPTRAKFLLTVTCSHSQKIRHYKSVMVPVGSAFGNVGWTLRTNFLPYVRKPIRVFMPKGITVWTANNYLFLQDHFSI